MPLVLRVSATSYAVIGISLGYFLVDAAVVISHPQISTTEMLVHHAVALLSLVVAAQVSGKQPMVSCSRLRHVKVRSGPGRAAAADPLLVALAVLLLSWVYISVLPLERSRLSGLAGAVLLALLFLQAAPPAATVGGRPCCPDVVALRSGSAAAAAAAALAHPRGLPCAAAAAGVAAHAAQVRCMHVYLMMVLMSEMTTPFVNLRWLLDKAGLKHLKLYTVNGLMLLLAWGVARVVLFVPFYLHVFQNWATVREIPLHALVLLVGVPLLLFCLNLIWFLKIARGAYKLVTAAKGREQQQQQHRDRKQQRRGEAGSSDVVEIRACSRRVHAD